MLFLHVSLSPGEYSVWNVLPKQAITSPTVRPSASGPRQIMTKGMVKPMDMCRLRRFVCVCQSVWYEGRGGQSVRPSSCRGKTLTARLRRLLYIPSSPGTTQPTAEVTTNTAAIANIDGGKSTLWSSSIKSMPAISS